MNQGEKKQTLLGCLFFVPSLTVFAVPMFYPLFYTVYLSFFEWNMVKPVKKFVGLVNYVIIFKDLNSRKIAGNMAMYTLILLVLNFMLSHILFFILLTVIKRGQGFYKAMFLLPSITSLVAESILYIRILNSVSGPVALVLKCSGLTLPFWSKTEEWIIVVPSIIISWKVFGYDFIIILAGVPGVSQEVAEAARLDSIPLWKVFRDMVVPMSSATGIYAFVTTIVQGLQYVFTPIKVVAQGSPNYISSNLIHMSYHEIFTLYHTGTSPVILVITMVLFVVLLLLEFRLVGKGVYYEN